MHNHRWNKGSFLREQTMSHHHHSWRRPKYNVPLNIQGLQTHYEVHLYATGFDKENIKVNVSDDVLIISGTRAIDEAKAPLFILQEFPVKNFERRVFLRGQVDAKSITAKQENGILILTLPKSEEAKASVVEIQVE